MTTLPSTRLASAAALLETYCQITQAEAESFILSWHQAYPSEWVYPAVVEALYQGRYKPVSAEQLLRFWQRRGQSLTHFSGEFESLIRVGTRSVSVVAHYHQTPARLDTFDRPLVLSASPDLAPAAETWAIAQFIPVKDPSGFTQRLQTVLAAATPP
jgi:hypothetical protein